MTISIDKYSLLYRVSYEEWTLQAKIKKELYINIGPKCFIFNLWFTKHCTLISTPKLQLSNTCLLYTSQEQLI